MTTAEKQMEKQALVGAVKIGNCGRMIEVARNIASNSEAITLWHVMRLGESGWFATRLQLSAMIPDEKTGERALPESCVGHWNM